MALDKQDITAVILAGGRGSRLGGKDKGLVEYNGKPMIEHVIDRIQPQIDAILINANRNLETYQDYGFPVINDELSDFQGPLAGFAMAMKTAKTSHIITMPCDGPFLTSSLVDRMVSKLAENHNHQTIVVAHDGKRLQPVYALIPCQLLASLEAFLANGDRKIDLWYAQHPMEKADFSDNPEVFSNINTEEQRQAYETRKPE